ncbi:hypothetical protein OHB14_51460 [Streptomyces sp. NBC_01613]|uniref:hypothetical protein n=1 Tax=Streptomyces sp. NBC_01613 TaxID=2975896 RepID=UPI00386EEB89
MYRLTHPEHDGLRRLGHQVHTADALSPAPTPGPPQPGLANGLLERRARIAQAAATRSPQSRAAPAASLRQSLPQPAAVPAGGPAQTAGPGRSR